MNREVTYNWKSQVLLLIGALLIWINDLKEDGRRLAIATHLQSQLDGDQYGSATTKDLLNHGVDGITAYVDSLDGGLINWIETIVAQSQVYGFMMELGDRVPLSIPKQLLKKSTKSSGEENAK